MGLAMDEGYRPRCVRGAERNWCWGCHPTEWILRAMGWITLSSRACPRGTALPADVMSRSEQPQIPSTIQDGSARKAGVADGGDDRRTGEPRTNPRPLLIPGIGATHESNRLKRGQTSSLCADSIPEPGQSGAPTIMPQAALRLHRGWTRPWLSQVRNEAFAGYPARQRQF